jgi:hypothetical protein
MAKKAKITGMVFTLFLVLMHPGSVLSEKNPQEPDQVGSLMDRAGLNKQLEEIPQLIEIGMTEANKETKSLTPELLKEVNHIAASAFDSGKLKKIMHDHLQANLSEAETQATLAWLNSPLARKISRMEEQASKPEAYTEMMGMADQLMANDGRVKLVKKLDIAVKATETAMSAAVNTQASLIAGLTSALKPEVRPTFEAIESEVKKNKGQMEPIIEAHTVLSYLYSYKDLTDDEIGRYLTFAESLAGKKYHSVVAAGLDTTLARAARSLADDLEKNFSRTVTEKKKKTEI